MSHRNPQQKLWIALGVQVAKIMKGSASIAVAAFVLGASQARAESVDVTFANATNAIISVTAKDLNDGGKIIAKDEVLKHNEQVTKKMVLKGSDGNVSYQAKGADSGYTVQRQILRRQAIVARFHIQYQRELHQEIDG